VIVAPATNNTTSKTIPQTFYVTKTTFILHQMLRLTHEIIFRQLDIGFFYKKIKISSHCLATFASLDAKQSIAQPQFYSTITNSPVRCAFWVR